MVSVAEALSVAVPVVCVASVALAVSVAVPVVSVASVMEVTKEEEPMTESVGMAGVLVMPAGTEEAGS